MRFLVMTRSVVLAVLAMAMTPAAMAQTMAAEAPGGPKKVAVMRTQTDGVDAGVGAQVSARIAEMTRLKTGAEVLSADQITTLLDHERDKQLVGCEQDSCLAEVADALGADVIVAARLSRIDGGYALTITALDAVGAKPLGAVDEKWGGEPLLLLEVIRPAVDRLFSPAGTVPSGLLVVDGVKDGSRILVDDVVRGTAPAGQLSVPVGAHRLNVTLADHESQSSWVIINTGQTTTVPIAQTAVVPAAAVYETWWFWTALGGGVAVAAAGTVGTVVLLGQGDTAKTGINVAINADDTLGGAR
jgi:hypothetical protein